MRKVGEECVLTVIQSNTIYSNEIEHCYIKKKHRRTKNRKIYTFSAQNESHKLGKVDEQWEQHQV